MIKMPSWFPGARFKRYAREWHPIVVGAVKAPYDKVKRELVSVFFFQVSLLTTLRCFYLGVRNDHSLSCREYYIET